jgi:hypothetical protein
MHTKEKNLKINLGSHRNMLATTLGPTLVEASIILSEAG